jgi:hypothetical protein
MRGGVPKIERRECGRRERPIDLTGLTPICKGSQGRKIRAVVGTGKQSRAGERGREHATLVSSPPSPWGSWSVGPVSFVMRATSAAAPLYSGPRQGSLARHAFLFLFLFSEKSHAFLF